MRNLIEKQTKTPLLQVDNLHKRFPLDASGSLIGRWMSGLLRSAERHVHAVNGVNFTIHPGDTFCLVGESGCGKSTIARMVAQLTPATQGNIAFDGINFCDVDQTQYRNYRRQVQMIFQNPFASLNPRMRIQETLGEPTRHHSPGLSRGEIEDRVSDLLQQVGIDPSIRDRYPHEFSGGQRQRISIARALTTDPVFLIADEAISALDVSIQAQILNLLMEARESRGLTYMFITHDLSVVRHFGSHAAVLYLGAVCEIATVETLFQNPRHPYTQALLRAIPKVGRNTTPPKGLSGDVPTPIDLPKGCFFASRCPHANNRCRTERPSLIAGEDALVACHAVEEGRPIAPAG